MVSTGGAIKGCYLFLIFMWLVINRDKFPGYDIYCDNYCYQFQGFDFHFFISGFTIDSTLDLIVQEDNQVSQMDSYKWLQDSSNKANNYLFNKEYSVDSTPVSAFLDLEIKNTQQQGLCSTFSMICCQVSRQAILMYLQTNYKTDFSQTIIV